MVRNIALTIEYCGINYSGWQIQQNAPTVQGEVERALSELCGEDVHVCGCSRTDAGVQADNFVLNFRTESTIPAARFPAALTAFLPGDIAARSAREVPDSFHARFDARGKLYRYIIDNNRDMSVFNRNYRYHVARPLDLDKMREAASFVVGTHDFKCFQASGQEPDVDTVKTVYSLEVFEEPAGEGLISLEVSGDGFLYNMVRIITGTLVEIGLGRKKPEDMKQIIEGRDRRAAGHTAPPQGLYLADRR